MRFLALLAAALCAPTLGCFDVNYGDVSFACGPAGDCPGGYQCRDDGLCHREGTPGGEDDTDAAGGDDTDAASGDDTDAASGDTDAAISYDAGDPPANDTCAAPAALTEDVVAAGTTISAIDDHSIATVCLAVDGPDAVHEIDLAGPAALLITATPEDDWDMAVSLREEASCTDDDPDVSCVATAPGPRYINRPTLADGVYDLVVDGAAGATGDYTLLYQTGPADATFGYWMLRTAGNTYTGLSGATSITPADETAVTVNLPFEFPFYGQTYQDVVISANGYLSFDLGAVAASDRYQNDCPFSDTLPNEMIAVFWDDLFPDSVAPPALRYVFEGAAPNRSMSVEWVNFDIFESSPCQGQCDSVQSLVQHTVVIYENGDIEFRYGPRQLPIEDIQCGEQQKGCSATIGLRGGEPFDADVTSCGTEATTEGTADIAAGDVIRWIYPR
jgi:hypothetical protein